MAVDLFYDRQPLRFDREFRLDQYPPEHIWKVIVVMDKPGQTLADVKLLRTETKLQF